METHTILQIIWFFLIGILFMGYSVLDGFDLGIGTAFPFLAKGDEGRQRALIRSIGPVWDGNEVWLLTAGGALFAAFPHAYATVFSGFYLALMLVLLGLILRAVSVEFFSLDKDNRKLWSATFFFGSALPSLLFGVALGNIVMGVPLDSAMEYRGTFFTLLRPFPLACGLLGLAAIITQGLTYAAIKTEGDLHEDSVKGALKVVPLYGLLFVVATALAFFSVEGSLGNMLAWIFAMVFLVNLGLTFFALKKGMELRAFTFSSLSFLSLWGIVAATQFPMFIKSSTEGIANITAYNASSSELTLSVMLGIAILGVPPVLGYTIYVYRVYRGKISHIETPAKGK